MIATEQQPSHELPGQPAPFRFGLCSLFVVTAAAAVIAAGGTYGGKLGILLASYLVLSAALGCLSKKRYVVVACCLFFGLVGILPMFLEPRVTTFSGQCKNRLHNLGLAIQAYSQQYRRLPPQATFDQNGAALHSWRTLLLPYLEEVTLSQAINLQQPWNHPDNVKVINRIVREFECPSVLGAANDLTSYVAVVGPNTAWQPGKTITLNDIKDGPSKTILLVELKNSNIPWAEPRDLDLQNLPAGITAANLTTILGNHPGGFNAVFADGSVRFIRDDIRPEVLQALFTIDGGEQFPDQP